jgi:hypothetical protein
MMADVVTRFANTWESTSRFSLLVKYEGGPAWQASRTSPPATYFGKQVSIRPQTRSSIFKKLLRLSSADMSGEGRGRLPIRLPR